MSRFLFILSLVCVGAAGVFAWQSVSFLRSEFPDVGLLKTRYPSVQYRGPSESPVIKLQRTPPPNWVSLPEVSKAAVGAIVVSEDWAFFQHKGYDPNQIKEAIREDWEQRRFARGASTITQQVVRNVFLDKDKNLWRKLKELFLAVQVEEKVRKTRILEIYLNIAEWGEGIFGIGPAAGFYFNKSPSELTAKEGAFLAMLLPSPKRYSQSFRAKGLTSYARETIESILEKMTQADYLTDEEKNAALESSLSFEQPAANPSPSPSPAVEGELEPDPSI